MFVVPVQPARCGDGDVHPAGRRHHPQKWSRNGLELMNVGSNKCLDATGMSSADGTRLQIRDCANTTNQQWNLP